MPTDPTHKVLLITGASRGIGAVTALLAAARGYAVCVNYRSNRDAAAQVVRDITEAGGTAVAVPGDVAVDTDVRRIFETCDQALGRVLGPRQQRWHRRREGAGRPDGHGAAAAHVRDQRVRVVPVCARSRAADVHRSTAAAAA